MTARARLSGAPGARGKESIMTPGPYIIIPPGGPAGPFYGLMNAQGNIVATQIVGEDNAAFLASAWEMWQLLIAVWEDRSALAAMSYETLQALERFMLQEDSETEPPIVRTPDELLPD